MKTSAGLLMYRIREETLEVFLAHPGGPFFKNKDEGWWTIPKGEIEPEEDMLKAAIREFKEETGLTPQGDFTPLGSVKQKSGKIVHAWAFRGDRDAGTVHCSNFFEMEWPPGSGKKAQFPEIDRAEFFPAPEAQKKINPAQAEFIDRLEKMIKERAAR